MNKDRVTKYFRTQSIRDIVSKIKFPHGLHNTVEELVSASNFPSDIKEWPTTIGQAPTTAEIEKSQELFKKEKYPNMYRQAKFFVLLDTT